MPTYLLPNFKKCPFSQKSQYFQAFHAIRTSESAFDLQIIHIQTNKYKPTWLWDKLQTQLQLASGSACVSIT